MIEVSLGAFAWFAVVTLQALFYGVLSPRRRSSQVELTLEDKRILDAIAEEEEEELADDGDALNCKTGIGGSHDCQDGTEVDGDETPLSLSPCLPIFGYSDSDDRSIEEEPQEIRQLLNQTGSELVSPKDRSMSFFERLAKEQLQENDVDNEESFEESLAMPQQVIGAY